MEIEGCSRHLPQGIEIATPEKPKYQEFLEGNPIAYSTKRDQLELALTLTHRGQSPRDGPIEFSAMMMASYGEGVQITWTSRQSHAGPHQLTREKDFGYFFEHLTSGAESVYRLIGGGGVSQHDLMGCLHEIERNVRADFCAENSKSLREEVIEALF